MTPRHSHPRHQAGVLERVLPALSILFIIAYTPVASSAGSYPKSSMYPPRPELEPLPESLSDHLSVNIANLERKLVRGKPEKDGVAEIVMLLKDSRFEEMWAFVPGERADDATWYEIGRDVTETVDGMAIRVDRPFLAQLMREHRQLHLYHFHPLSYFERCRRDTSCGDPAVPRNTTQASKEDLITNVRYAMPSPEDIYFMMDVSWEFKRIRGGEGELRHRVVTPYGVVDYALTAEGQARYDYDRSLRTGGLYIALVAGNALLDEAIAGIVNDIPGDIDEILQRVANNLSGRHLRVLYTPHSRTR